MVDPHREESFYSHNERSLQTLARALVLSQGEFELILVLCNYARLRAETVRNFRQRCSVKMCEMVLPKSVTQLHATILGTVSEEFPQALMVLGLESAIALDDLLVSTNRMRDQFCQNFPFPLVLWVTDIVLHKLTRLAPDFKSFAAPTIKFEMPTQQLIDFLRTEADSLFARVLQTADNASVYSTFDWTTSTHRQELDDAFSDLQSRGVSLDPDLEASLAFLRGREAFINDDMERSRQLYEQSLAFWEEGESAEVKSQKSKVKSQNSSSSPLPDSVYRERQGCLLFYLGVWWLRYAVLHRSQYADACSQARDRLQQCIDIFEQLSRQDVVAKFINALGEAYKRLQQWDLLEMVATRSRDIHQIYPDFTRLAQAYGFLAEVALSKSAWNLAKERAETAIQIVLNAQESESVANVEQLGPNLDWAKRWHKSWYLLLLGRSLSCLGQVREAIEKLETAKAQSDRRYAPQLYIEILEKLRELYFQEGRYLEAFRLKQEQSSIEHQYGFRAFIGAGCLQPQRQALNPVRKPFEQGVTVAAEIIALRWQDVNRLIDRLSRSDRKLTVIHGEPGVGKTSLIKAGLVPLLKQRLIEDPAPTRSGFKSERIALPVVLSNYSDWVIGLGRLLTEGLQEIKLANRAITFESPERLDSVEAIAEQLRINSDRHLLNVLIFDQFEQFFCVCTEPVERRRFYDFLRVCLNLPFVKILLSMREDYLHYLLEWERIANLDVINNNILDKDMRYYLENVSVVDAQLAIERLTARAQFQLENALIEEFVRSLAGERGVVRPMELQVLGATLQSKKITTLTQYRQLGSKEKLVELFLDVAIRDCGTPNEQVARLVLYSLTDDRGNCVRKTRAELVAELKIIGLEVEPEKIDLVLTVLVGVGLVFLQPEVPADRYQLIYGYLLPFIRQQQVSVIVEQLRRERARQTFAEEQLRFVEQANQILIAAQQKAKKIILRGFVGLALISVIAAAVTILAGFFARKAEWQKQLAERKEIEALNTVSEARLLSRDRVGALVASVKAGKKLQEIEEPPDLKLLTVIRLHEALYSDKDSERVEGSNTIKKFNLRYDDQTTEYLWHLDKKQIQIKLDELLLSGCDRLRDYLQTNPHIHESDRQLCTVTPNR
ncbi:hypothetical protein ACE1CD_27990 [Aerosakkonema sp. BLCC-F183]|uniref:nSTAND1 domain-containing NTPase n=1 Tax=Aerosakkonema sp. BLCC-F183 TaxID=3342834 RepID=UPI0035BB8CA9